MKTKGNNFVSNLILLCILVCCLFSCNKTEKDSNFQVKLEVIDVYINNNQLDSAKKEIKKLEKSALAPNQILSIAKRYLSINDLQLTENYLQGAIKKIPNNPEINALYGYLLLKQNKFSEALPILTLLQDTDYASLYSEILFANGFTPEQAYSADFIDTYKVAYNSTKNTAWLKNAASLTAKNISVSDALKFKPLHLQTEDLLFWSLLEYDAENYYDVIELLMPSIDSKSSAKEIALVSDSLLSMGEYDKASSFWASSYKQKLDNPLEVYVNSALHFDSVSDYENERSVLLDAVQKFPYNKDILALYADFAVQSLARRNQDTSLLNTNLKTIKAETTSNSPLIPLSDAIYRLENALQNQFDLAIYVEYVKLQWQINETPAEERIVQLYEILEKYRENDNYNDYLVYFAFKYLCSNFREDDAIKLFNSYFAKKYGSLNFIDFVDDLTLYDCEMAAFVCAYEQKAENAILLYEKLCLNANSKAKDYCVVNLAMLYDSVGKQDEALKLYSSVANKKLDSVLSSDVHYRIAKIKMVQNDTKNALESLNYSIYLNPNNNRARFLLKQIN